MTKNKIIGCGGYLPKKTLTNDDLSKFMDTSDEWIQKRTGIKERHIADDYEVCSDLALQASLSAISNAKISVDDIDLIIVATSTPDKTFPSTATILQHKLGIKNSTAFDISAACSGFVYALTLADALMLAKSYKNSLVVGAEVFSRLLDYNDRSTAVLFGDGAGAFILTKSENDSGIYYNKIYSDGGFSDILKTNGGTSSTKTSGTIEMSGREVFKLGVEKMSSIILEALNYHKKIDWIIPHQANIRMIKTISEVTKIPFEKFLTTVDIHANTSAASIPLAFSHFVNNNVIKQNDNILFVSIGAGVTWGGVSLIF